MQKQLRAFTLLETVVSIAIITIIMSVIVLSILFFYRTNASSLEQSFQINSARKGVEFMVQDLREAIHGDDGSYPLLTIGSTTITFFSDTDSDQSVERITYSLSGTRLERITLDSLGIPPSYSGLGVTTNVSEYVRNLETGKKIFRYYDKDGVEITNYTDIGGVRFISVNLIVNIQPIRAPEEFTLRSSATLRNLRNE